MKPMTAQELMDQLAKDPDYQSRMKEKEERLQPIWDARKRDEEQLVKEINEIGYPTESVYDLVNIAPHGLFRIPPRSRIVSESG